MKLSAPKFITWFIALIVGVAAILMTLGIVSIPLLAGYVFWMAAGAFGLLTLATLLKGL